MQDLHCYEEKEEKDCSPRSSDHILQTISQKKNTDLDINRSYTPIEGGCAEFSCCGSRHVRPSGEHFPQCDNFAFLLIVQAQAGSQSTSSKDASSHCPPPADTAVWITSCGSCEAVMCTPPATPLLNPTLALPKWSYGTQGPWPALSLCCQGCCYPLPSCSCSSASPSFQQHFLHVLMVKKPRCPFFCSTLTLTCLPLFQLHCIYFCRVIAWGKLDS